MKTRGIKKDYKTMAQGNNDEIPNANQLEVIVF